MFYKLGVSYIDNASDSLPLIMPLTDSPGSFWWLTYMSIKSITGFLDVWSN